MTRLMQCGVFATSIFLAACVDDAAAPEGDRSMGGIETQGTAGGGTLILLPDDPSNGGPPNTGANSASDGDPGVGDNPGNTTDGPGRPMATTGGQSTGTDDASADANGMMTGVGDGVAGTETGGTSGAEDDPRPRCADNDDCDSGYCVPAPDGTRVCTTVCGVDDDCPEAWICSAIANTRPDTVFICVAPRQVQCLACERDTDCGAQTDRCIQIGRGLRCAQDCSTIECPDGTVCEDISIDDGMYRLCRPENGQCAPCIDEDGDGYGNEGDCLGLDCNDQDINVNPEAAERCDMVDNNCNGQVDEIAECAPCVDEDGDGFGNTGNCRGLDCDDESMVTFPGADELCDGIDNDCDTRADEDILAPPIDVTCLPFGVCGLTQPACTGGEWTCAYPDTFEAETELTCDNEDNDCDGAIDESFAFDSDPLNCGGCDVRCELPRAITGCAEFRCTVTGCLEGWHNVDGDDTNGCEYACVPDGDTEACDGRDNDCDGSIDEGFADQPDAPDRDGIDSNCDGIDGRIDGSIFVSLDGDDDANSGLTPDEPVRSLETAFDLLFGHPERTDILVQSGTYAYSATINLPPTEVVITAGYAAGFLARDNQPAIIESTASVILRADALPSPVTVNGFIFRSPDEQAEGQARIGVIVDDSSTDLRFINTVVDVGRGGSGQGGTDGFDGGAGTDGADAGGRTGGQGGATGGGAGATGERQRRGRSGRAGLPDGERACNDPSAVGGGGGLPGAGGSGGLGCGDGDAGPGSNGGRGCDGTPGADGQAGSNVGELSEDLTWRAIDGTDGTPGRAGGGGGGGGAGVGEDCSDPIFDTCSRPLFSCGTGRGGGGGGGGGQGGTAGTGGRSGGGSVGMIIRTSTVTLIDTTIRTGGGGDGGRGGAFGRGGFGGAGGQGAVDNDNTGRKGAGGDGGDGGDGGRGGCGGGGGGGPSIGILGAGMAQVRVEGVSFDIGRAGQGGPSCEQASGEPGLSGELIGVEQAVDDSE
ncbi:MAG: putative metal-binding motif-containing protein [Myxococcota bacterium]|nr:putative metal-binding motif-containing protein [Myxococcota bacterium]